MTIATDRSAGTDAVQAANTWVATKLRYLLEVNPPTPVELRAQCDRFVPFTPMEALGEDGSLDTTRERPVAELLSGYSYFANGDVLMAKVTPCFENGKAALVQSLPQKHGFGSTEITTLRASEGLDPAFLHYFVRSDHFRQASIASMTGAGGLKRVPDEHIRSFRTVVPSETEQRAITDFLDRETTKIDALIDKQEQLIATLREDRAATITQAVTKGLDPSVPMQRTGVEWLGEVPADWMVLPLRHLGEPIIGLTYAPDDTAVGPEESTLVLRSSNIQNGSLELSDCVYVKRDIPERLRLRKGDILICSRNGSRALIGKNILIDQRTSGETFGAFMTVFRSAHNRFLYWMFNSRLFESQMATFLSSTINQLTTGNLKQMTIPFPPTDQQEAISAHLDSRCRKIDVLIEKSTQMIETLREYRSALITNAVTGKIDVREGV